MSAAESDPRPAPEARPAGPCRFLRTKSMYVFTDGSGDDHGDDNSIFWCLQTMKNYGPDDDFVDRQGCCDGSRSCHEPI